MNPNVNKFKEITQSIANLTKGRDLIHRTEWGEINFEMAETDVKSVIHMAIDLCSLPIELLPDSVLTQGCDTAGRLMQHLQKLDGFSLTVGGDINNRRNDLVNRIHQASDEFSRTVGLWIPYLSYHRGDAEENIKKLNQTITAVEQHAKEHLLNLSKSNNEARQLIENIKSTSAEAGVAVFTQDFSDESVKNDVSAKKWLTVTIAMAAITLIVLAIFYRQSLGMTANANLSQVVPVLGCRVLIVSFLFTFTVWCGHMYKAMRNQAMQNRHRALGLKTFRAFADASSDTQTRDAVLRETTHSIFSSTPTGLIADVGSSDSDSSIVQIAGGMIEAMIGLTSVFVNSFEG